LAAQQNESLQNETNGYPGRLKPMKLSQLLAALPEYQAVLTPNIPASTLAALLSHIEITKIASDSRQVEPGALFVAYQGVSVDGHRFISQAITRGAAAIVCETATGEWFSGQPPVIIVPQGREALAYLAAAWHNFPSRQIFMVGVTGTDGKTTTTNFLYQILRAAHRKVSMINTVNAVIGDAMLETGLHTTTPDAPDIQRYLAAMVQAGTEVCLLETTSHGLAQHRVTACDFDIAIVTNITHEHLDIHSTLEAYRAAKAALFESLATAADKGLPKTAILNCDDWSFGYLKERLADAKTTWLGYSLAGHPEASLIARNIIYRPDKTIFTIQGPGYAFEAASVLPGDYNVSNCLAAVTAAIECFGVSPAAAQQGIAALQGVPGRMERINEGQPFTAMVDFAHTPNSLRRSLTTARTLTSGRVIAVFGCAGLRDVEKRILMGEIATELADIALITAEDPRTEDLPAIMAVTAEAMRLKGGVEGQTFERIPDRGRAIYRAVQLAQPGDLVIALGKGHEQSMCFGQTEYPWDDREAMRAALRGQPLLTLPSARWS
jgi:UDP-N-acetylmuramoyl-L-alanyl-D-glutamate--2,6-diaminopimelate ligase